MLAAIMNFLFRSEGDVMVEELSQLGHLQLEFEKLPLTIVSHKKKILTAMWVTPQNCQVGHTQQTKLATTYC